MDREHWVPEDIRALREEFNITRFGKKAFISQTVFGDLLGGYTQATISGWEDLDGYGCTNRRSVRALNVLRVKIDSGELDEFTK